MTKKTQPTGDKTAPFIELRISDRSINPSNSYPIHTQQHRSQYENDRRRPGLRHVLCHGTDKDIFLTLA